MMGDSFVVDAIDVAQNRQRLSKMLQLHGYSACCEALVLLEDHYLSSTKYESMEDFTMKINNNIAHKTEDDSSIITPDLAHLVIKLLRNENHKQVEVDQNNEIILDAQIPQVPITLNIKVKNVQCEHNEPETGTSSESKFTDKHSGEYGIHYNFLFKKLCELPVFQGEFKITSLASLTASNQPQIRCICFGLLVKDKSKIDGYLLIDSSSRVPVRITPDTSFRNSLAYLNCIVVVEGLYVNPGDVLYAANIGLPPILLNPVQDKSLACADDNLVVILKELYLDQEEVCNSLEMLFVGYNSMEQPPILFILIGDFTGEPCEPNRLRVHMKKLIKIIKNCDNLKSCHFVFVPGQRDTTPVSVQRNDQPFNRQNSSTMPKNPLTKEQLPLNLLTMSNFKNIHLATNPTHIFLGERFITVVSHSYFKELGKGLLHDLSDRREELFETSKKIILSNAHLTAGISKTYLSSMKLWHKPDLLVLADSEAFGNKYDYSSSELADTSFATIPSFSRQYYQFKVYYVNSGQIEDSQVSSDAIEEIEEVTIDDSDQVTEESPTSELD